MSVTSRRKNQIVRTLGMYWAEQGRIPKFYEYKADGKRPRGYTPKYILQHFDNWEHLLKYFKNSDPELWKLCTGEKEIVKETYKDPLEALRASTTEKTYE